MSDLVAATSEYHPERAPGSISRCGRSPRPGRTTEALQLFRTTRQRLIEEHGVEPGKALVDLHTAILRGETCVTEAHGRHVQVEETHQCGTQRGGY
jgi:hypothetical protein